MPASHVVAAPRGGVHRVGRGLDPFAFGPPPTPLPDAGEPVVGGNRFDDPAGRFTTLYAASSEEAAFGETIAAYRDRDGLLDRIDEFLNAAADPDHDPELRAGVVPPDYFADRYLGRAPVDASVRFVDLDHPRDTRRGDHSAARTAASTPPANGRSRRAVSPGPPRHAADSAPLLGARADRRPPPLGGVALRQPAERQLGVLGDLGAEPDPLARDRDTRGQAV